MKPAEIAEKLRAAYSSAQRRDLALDLLDATTSRQYIDLALDELSADDVRITLTDAHRPRLRKKALYYFDQPPEKDTGGMIREAIIRLLAGIGRTLLSPATRARRGAESTRRLFDRAGDMRRSTRLHLCRASAR